MACKRSRLHRPCHTRPADRSLVAEDRSARGVHDRTRPEPAGTRWVHAEPAGSGAQRARVVTTGAKEPQVTPPAQPPPGSLQEAGQSSSLPTRLPRAPQALANEAMTTGDGRHTMVVLRAVTATWNHQPRRPCHYRTILCPAHGAYSPTDRRSPGSPGLLTTEAVGL
jgi:hypothetical protein